MEKDFLESRTKFDKVQEKLGYIEKNRRPSEGSIRNIEEEAYTNL